MSEEKKMGVLDRYRDRDRSAEEIYSRHEKSNVPYDKLASEYGISPGYARRLCSMVKRKRSRKKEG